MNSGGGEIFTILLSLVKLDMDLAIVDVFEVMKGVMVASDEERYELGCHDESIDRQMY